MKKLVMPILSFSLLFIFSGCAQIKEFQKYKMELQKSYKDPQEELQKYYQKMDKLTQEHTRLIKEMEERDQKIYDNPIKLGLTKKEVILLWGGPDKINRSVGNYGIHEQWIYMLNSESRLNRETRYLYFENDILTSFQD